MILVLVLFASVLTVHGVVDDGILDTCNLTPIDNCSLYPFKTDLVNLDDMVTKNVVDSHWLMIYYSQHEAHQSIGKCHFYWHQPDSDNVVRRQMTCYNIDTDECDVYDFKLQMKTDSCGRSMESALNLSVDSKFYSQDLTQYFWYDTCCGYNENGQCTLHYLDLFVRDTRYPDADAPTSDIDLNGLPWHLISADLKNNFKYDFSHEHIKFTWKGPECGYDGKIKMNMDTSRASRMSIGLLSLGLISILAYMF